MFKDDVMRVTSESLEEAQMEHIKRGTPVKWEKKTAQNHFVSLILCKK